MLPPLICAESLSISSFTVGASCNFPSSTIASRPSRPAAFPASAISRVVCANSFLPSLVNLKLTSGLPYMSCVARA
jgi:hypothetical protein